MGEVFSSQTSVVFHQIAQRYIQEDIILYDICCEHLKANKTKILLRNINEFISNYK
jgi:hypothetical protein